MSNDGYDIDLMNRFLKNRMNKSNIIFTEQEIKERLEILNTIFKIFIGIYGKQFAEQYDNDFSKDLWLQVLFEFSREEIEEGLEKVIEDDYVSPPNLKRFASYCRKDKQDCKKERLNALPKLNGKSKNKGLL